LDLYTLALDATSCGMTKTTSGFGNTLLFTLIGPDSSLRMLLSNYVIALEILIQLLPSSRFGLLSGFGSTIN
jgi:hypothetical protein